MPRWAHAALQHQDRIAEELLRHLEAEGTRQRWAQGLEGARDAWIWAEREPPVAELMGKAASEVCGAGKLEAWRVDAVASRLLGRLHLPAVQEALGCLIPQSLDPALDGVKPKGRAQAGSGPGGVALDAGQWAICMKQHDFIRSF